MVALSHLAQVRAGSVADPSFWAALAVKYLAEQAQDFPVTRLSGRPPNRMVALSHKAWSQCALCGRPPIRMAALSDQARQILAGWAEVVDPPFVWRRCPTWPRCALCCGPPIRMAALSHQARRILAGGAAVADTSFAWWRFHTWPLCELTWWRTLPSGLRCSTTSCSGRSLAVNYLAEQAQDFPMRLSGRPPIRMVALSH